MKIIFDILFRTLFIIKTHICYFKDYKSYSLLLQYKGYRGMVNKDYGISFAAELMDSAGFPRKNLIGSTENREFKYLSSIEKDNSRYHIKEFYYTGWESLLRNSFRSSRAKKFYAVYHQIKGKGISVPEAVCYLDKRFMFFTLSCVIITRDIPGTEAFTVDCERVLQNSPDGMPDYLRLLAELIFKLNTIKILHTDLLGNILVSRNGSMPVFHLIDLDAVKAVGFITKFDIIKHFEGFYDLFVKKRALSEQLWNILCREYLYLDSTAFASIEEITEHVKNRKNLLYYFRNR